MAPRRPRPRSSPAPGSPSAGPTIPRSWPPRTRRRSTALKLPAGFKARATIGADLNVFAPSVAGEYLLVLDIVTPEAGSLTAKGVAPTMIRVTVAPKPVTTAPAAGGSGE